MSDHFILIGHPVSHSMSPAIHGSAYRALGRAATYTLEDAPDAAAVGALLDRIKSGEFAGANVTVPWKTLALELCERADDTARLVGAANVIARAPGGELVAYNTDALALADELGEARRSAKPHGRTALVLGAGGAALASVVACQKAGFDQVRVTARRFTAELPRSEWPLFEAFERLGAESVAWPSSADDAAWRDLGALVQATSAGMKGKLGGEELAELVPWRSLAPLVAYDLVYNPAETPFLVRAGESGHYPVGGLGMLARQAALAIEIWWGILPEPLPLEQAAREALAHG